VYLYDISVLSSLGLRTKRRSGREVWIGGHGLFAWLSRWFYVGSAGLAIWKSFLEQLLPSFCACHAKFVSLKDQAYYSLGKDSR
jgi:hypothetical protein